MAVIVSYADPRSGNNIPDTAEVDSDGANFVASEGMWMAICAAHGAAHAANGAITYIGATLAPAATGTLSWMDLDQS
jgi:hypothetical protein